MLDHAMRKRQGKPYDKDGALGRTGKVNAKLMARLKDLDFFKRPVSRSAWRLDFGSSHADAFMADYAHLSDTDLMATVTEFAACAITRSVTDNVKSTAEIAATASLAKASSNCLTRLAGT